MYAVLTDARRGEAHPASLGSNVGDDKRGGELQKRVYSDLGALKSLNKRFRQLGSREMTRTERSELYSDILDLFDQLYNVFQDPDAPQLRVRVCSCVCTYVLDGSRT